MWRHSSIGVEAAKKTTGERKHLRRTSHRQAKVLGVRVLGFAVPNRCQHVPSSERALTGHRIG